MNQSIPDDSGYDLRKWFNNNRETILNSYPNQYIAFNAVSGLLAHDHSLEKVQELAHKTGENYVIYLVPPNSQFLQILPILFRSVVRHQWQPNYPVKLKHKQKEIDALMLVDSEAEISLISLKIGQDLGLSMADAESTLLAETIGGRVEYVVRNLDLTIDGHSFIAPVAWLQTPADTEQLLLGRDIVFDKFDIHFKQAEEKIIFIWRNSL